MATRYNRYIWALYLTSNNMLNGYVARLDRNAITDGSVGSGVRYSYVGEDYILYDGTTISVSREGNQTKFTVTSGGSIPYPHSVSSEYATRLKTLAFECDVQVNQSGWTSFIKQSGVSPFSVTKTYTVNNGFDTVQFRYTFADLNGAAIENFTLSPIYKSSHTITVKAGTGGSVSGGGTYEEGTSVTVKATASSGYRFSRWTEGGATVSSNASYTFTVTQNRTLTAVFSKILPSYRITVTASPANGGTVSGGGSYESGRSATVRATPAADFLFVEWQEDGVAVSTNPTYTFTVSKARTLTAVFKRKLSAYVGIEGKARKATNLYVGVDGKARKVVRAYIGVDGKAQKFL